MEATRQFLSTFLKRRTCKFQNFLICKQKLRNAVQTTANVDRITDKTYLQIFRPTMQDFFRAVVKQRRQVSNLYVQ